MDAFDVAAAGNDDNDDYVYDDYDDVVVVKVFQPMVKRFGIDFNIRLIRRYTFLN